MENIKNKIITISGQPVTGKSTNIKILIKKLEKQGYLKENIHLKSTGEEFRNYFNKIVEFIKNMDDEEKSKELSELSELQNFFKNEEYRKTFLNTIKDLKSKNINVSDLTIEQANNMAEIDGIRKIVDTLIDEKMKNDGEEINKTERPNEIWIIDSRLAFSNIPESFSVRLTANPEVAAKRLLNDKSRGQEDRKYANIEEAKLARENRRIGENKRYKERYGIDLEKEENYDLIIDTSYSTVDDISDVIIQCMNNHYNNKEYAKKWTSPKMLLPLQTERDTLGRGAINTFEELLESIEKNGYNPFSEVEVVEVDNIKGIIEGHHRNFAAAYLGKTLIPYKVLARDNEKIEGYNGIARERIEGMRFSDLMGHEGFFEKQGEKFSYSDIYPKLYEKLYLESQIER